MKQGNERALLTFYIWFYVTRIDFIPSFDRVICRYKVFPVTVVISL